LSNYREMIASIEDILAFARSSLNRVSAYEAAQLSDGTAVLVDIRPFEQRSRDGEIPGALVIDRNVFEWRLDPASPYRVPEIEGYDQLIIVVCNEGYASSLAAKSLQDLGLRRATDLIDGFVAWRAAGLPIGPAHSATVERGPRAVIEPNQAARD
jgi:rhodanese-related sulfurtransferase